MENIANTKKEPINLNDITGYNAANKNKKPNDTSKLDNDAFMKLFLEQLKNQDPTAPMETDKIITQTAQLTQVEMQEKTKQTMIEVAEAMKSTKATNEELKNFQADMKTTLEALAQSLNVESPNIINTSPYSSVGMIGKIVETKVNGLNVTNGQGVDFELYFDEPIDTSLGSPKILIINENNEVVREMDISEMVGKSGYIGFSWDAKDNNGEFVPNGAYSVVANYNFTNDGNYNLTRLGRGEIQSVIFDNGKPNLRLGELIVPLDDALEFYARSN